MSHDPASAREALMQASRDWAAAAASGDLERALAYWTDDAIVLPPDQPAVVGKRANQLGKVIALDGGADFMSGAGAYIVSGSDDLAQ